jgi:hypothetical protein
MHLGACQGVRSRLRFEKGQNHLRGEFNPDQRKLNGKPSPAIKTTRRLCQSCLYELFSEFPSDVNVRGGVKTVNT